VAEVNWLALWIFLALFGFVSWLGFAAARWRRGDLDQLHEWGLGGRRFGTIVTWFLVGGDLYTAYTFIAVPALAFGSGAIAFFAVPYTVIIYPLLFLVFRRLWHVCHKHGYITAGDFVRGRFGNRWLALAVTVTGIVATMPYIALQLVGIQVVVGALGVAGDGLWGDMPLIVAFLVLAAFTFSSGLRAPASIAIVKDVLIYLTAFAAIIVIPTQLGGFAKIFAAVPAQKLLLAVPGAHTTGAYSAYATLALGSALALFLYPHSLTAILSASSGHAIRRNAALLPGYSFVLGLLALLGFFAIAAGVHELPEYAAGFARFGSNFAVPALLLHSFPSWFVGIAFVDRGGESVHTQHSSRVREPEPDAPPGIAGRKMGLFGRQARRAAVHLVRAHSVRDPAAVARRHLDHPDAALGHARRLHALVQCLGAARRLGGGHSRRHGDGDCEQTHAELPARARRSHVPGLYGRLHAVAESRARRFVDTRVHTRRPRPASGR
jgi:Na+/pantothenate symporter